jgi:hypothetical protein
LINKKNLNSFQPYSVLISATHNHFGFLPTVIVVVICQLPISIMVTSLDDVLETTANFPSGVSSIQFWFLPTIMLYKTLSVETSMAITLSVNWLVK